MISVTSFSPTAMVSTKPATPPARAADGDYKTAGPGHSAKDADGDYRPAPVAGATPAASTLAAALSLPKGG